MSACTNPVIAALSWSMLAASTLGPGSVVVCSVSGASYGLHLLWCLLLACFLAATLLETSGRLAIHSGLSLGEAMRRRYSMAAGRTPVACWLAAFGIVVGNTAYVANNFAGGIAAVFVLFEESAVGRMIASLTLGIATSILVLRFNLACISKTLGTIVFGMTLTFAFATCYIGAIPRDMLYGFGPNIPDGSAVLVLSLIGTTIIPYNLFLAASIASKYSVDEMQNGVRVAMVVTFTASVLITIVGTSVEDGGGSFTVARLALAIRNEIGVEPQTCFAVGLMCAAFSACIGCTTSAALCLQTLLFDRCLECEPVSNQESGALETDGNEETSSSNSIGLRPKSVDRANPGRIFAVVMLGMMVVGVVVGASGINTVNVVLTAQVINGCLLPGVVSALMLCVNDAALMGDHSQTVYQNSKMYFSLGCTIFLSSFALISKLLLLGGQSSGDLWACGSAAMLVVVWMLFIHHGVKCQDGESSSLSVGTHCIETSACPIGMADCTES